MLNNLILRCTRRDRITVLISGLLFVSFIAAWQAVVLFSSNGPAKFLEHATPNTYSVFEIDTFNTSMAKLTIIDMITVDPFNRTTIKRRILNMDRDEIFVSEADLVLPKNLSQIDDTRKLSVDYTKLNPAAQPLVSPPFATESLSYRKNSRAKVLIIGLGGSQMNNFLHHMFPMTDITVVELENEMLKIAQKYFGLLLDDKQRVVIMDGQQFIKESAEKNLQFDAIYIDVCPTRFPLEDEILCPIDSFMEELTIKNMKKSLSPKGTLVVKMLLFVRNVSKASEEIADKYRVEFPHCAVAPMVSDLNRALVCGNELVDKSLVTEESLTNGFRNFASHFKFDDFPGLYPYNGGFV